MAKGVVVWALIGWIIAYNVVRIVAGTEPNETLLPSLAVGAVVGGVLYLLVIRRVVAAFMRRDQVSPDAIEPPQEDALRLAAWAMAGFGAVALVMAVILLVDFVSAPAGDRPVTSLVLGLWNLVATLWVADEIARTRVLDLDGLDFGVVITSLTAIMAALGVSRDVFAGGQVVLLVVAAVAGAVIGLAVWRLTPARRLPILAPSAVLVAAVALVLSLVS